MHISMYIDHFWKDVQEENSSSVSSEVQNFEAEFQIGGKFTCSLFSTV